MRILTVSAHYPPNFVSGGTLQPQRISRGLAALGHDVSVFAGWLGDRPPLDSWSDEDDTGLPVRWVVTTPWTGWDDPRNWHNPEVTALFRAHLAEVEPDVVHVHSLQSLGAGLLGAAHEAGAKVVVTMHDFWWICSRQFLVDTHLRPCSLVVDSGVCACHAGREASDLRREGLRTLLAPADLVLAPSASAVAVLVANGVAAGRVEVDENGLPPASLGSTDTPVAVRTRSSPDRTVRFLYTGGPNPMKGAAVVVDAVRHLADVPGWHLTTHGLGEHLDEHGLDLAGLPVDVLPAFTPDELNGILAAHDVFVLPSVMRETYSIATREALGAGLPVITTDTLGPEEVVDHGRNGLVVPAGDASALADAITSLASDLDLLAHLQEGARAPVATRTIDDHVQGLAARFAALLDAATGADPVTEAEAEVEAGVGRLPRLPRKVVFVCGIDGAPLRYRAHLPAEALADLGVQTEVRHYRDPELLGLCGTADVVVFYRVPATHQVLELIDALHGSDIPCAFDVDDLIFDPGIADEIPALRLLPPDEARLWLEGVNRYRTTMEACDAYIGSTEMLVDHAASVSGLPAHRYENGVGRLLARASDAALGSPRTPGPLRIGYFSGTTTHDEDWFHIEPAVLQVLDKHPDAELWLGGHLPESAALGHLGERLHRIPFLPWLDLPAALRDLDVNLAPLAPGSRFNEAKSAIKWLEAALVATPTVASPTQPFREAIEPGVSGLLADHPDEWVEALELLLSDAGARARIGARARRRALLTWSPAVQGLRYATILAAVMDAGVNRSRASSWDRVANDEPAMAHTLAPYPPADAADHLRVPAPPAPDGAAAPAPVTPVEVNVDRARRVVALGRRGAASVRDEGPAVTARKAARKLVRKGIRMIRVRLGPKS